MHASPAFTPRQVVAFIDSHYLRSPNCLQELAFLRHYNKPLVALVQDDGAFNVITKPIVSG